MPPLAQATYEPGPPLQWWERRWVWVVLVLLSLVPLLYPPIPPLVDLLGHMGRYRVELAGAGSPFLQRYYAYHWAAIGNLGVDVLILPMSKIFGLELGVKLIVLSIPAMTVVGFLWVAREVNLRLPPTALFALPFVYGHPFMFGFVNFALSMAIAFLAFALWLRLGRLGATRVRGILFVPISLIIFFCHTYGWGALGLLCFSAEAVRQHDRGNRWLKAGLAAAIRCVVMALPLVVMLIWRSETHGGLTSRWFDWRLKLDWIYSALRDRWYFFDMGSVVIAGIVLGFALASGKMTFSRNLAFSSFVLMVAFILLPWTVFGSAYADMRLVPYMIAVMLLGIRFRDHIHLPTAHVLAALGLIFFLVRLGGTTVSMAMASDDQQAKLEALQHVPVGARVVALVGRTCGNGWILPRNSHLSGMVIVRRDGFSNDQWVEAGLNLLDLRYKAAGKFASDPSQIVIPNYCGRSDAPHIDRALGAFPRSAFDYLWLIDPPAFDPSLVAGLQPVWRGRHSVLYRLHP